MWLHRRVLVLLLILIFLYLLFLLIWSISCRNFEFQSFGVSCGKIKIWNELLFIMRHSKFKLWSCYFFFHFSLSTDEHESPLKDKARYHFTTFHIVEEEFSFCDQHCTSQQYYFCLNIGNEDEPITFGLIYKEASWTFLLWNFWWHTFHAFEYLWTWT